MLQLPEVLKATDQLAREREAGQVSLFGGFDAATPALRIDLPETDEWPLTQMLNGERETLGHYLSGHPFDPYREEIRGLVGNDLGGLEKIWENRPEPARGSWRQEVETVVAGQVVGLRKKGDSQMFVQIEDGRGRLECAFFNETYSEFAQLLVRDRLLVIQGGLREDSFSGGFALRALALLGLRTGLRAPCAAAVAAPGPARTRHLAACRQRCWPATVPGRRRSAWTCCCARAAPACSTSTARSRSASMRI